MEIDSNEIRLCAQHFNPRARARAESGTFEDFVSTCVVCSYCYILLFTVIYRYYCGFTDEFRYIIIFPAERAIKIYFLSLVLLALPRANSFHYLAKRIPDCTLRELNEREPVHKELSLSYYLLSFDSLKV